MRHIYYPSFCDWSIQKIFTGLKRAALKLPMLRKIWVIGLCLAVIAMAKTKASPELREAMFYQTLDDNRVRCELCFRRCVIAAGKRGICRNRENREGKLYNIVHSRPSALHIDPIEKEPQLHMLPGTEILCLGTAGCNFRCRFCHN